MQKRSSRSKKNPDILFFVYAPLFFGAPSKNLLRNVVHSSEFFFLVEELPPYY